MTPEEFTALVDQIYEELYSDKVRQAVLDAFTAQAAELDAANDREALCRQALKTCIAQREVYEREAAELAQWKDQWANENLAREMAEQQVAQLQMERDHLDYKYHETVNASSDEIDALQADRDRLLQEIFTCPNAHTIYVEGGRQSDDDIPCPHCDRDRLRAALQQVYDHTGEPDIERLAQQALHAED